VDPEVQEMIVAGGGEYEGFDVLGGRAKLCQLLAKGERRITNMKEGGKGLVIDGRLANLMASRHHYRQR
jgi:hypothetical protein